MKPDDHKKISELMPSGRTLEEWMRDTSMNTNTNPLPQTPNDSDRDVIACRICGSTNHPTYCCVALRADEGRRERVQDAPTHECRVDRTPFQVTNEIFDAIMDQITKGPVDTKFDGAFPFIIYRDPEDGGPKRLVMKVSVEIEEDVQ